MTPSNSKPRPNRVQPHRVALAALLSVLLFLGQTAPIFANPTGGTVVAGSATIGAAGLTLNINQASRNAIINWQSFSIANGEATKFIVPNSGATLNRVTGGNPSAIYGALSSNGALYLVNPSGVIIGPSGSINTASFLASTLDVSNQQFLAGGSLTFSGGSSASIQNQGIIHATGGDVYLIANQVDNKGTLSAPRGTVGLAAGSEVLLQQSGSQHLFIEATPSGAKRALGVNNSGTIKAAAAELTAAGGNAYALAINNTGSIVATGFKKINGQVLLTSDGGNITNAGTISATTSAGNGGTILVEGSAVKAASSGTVTNTGLLKASATVAGGQGGSITLKSKDGATGTAIDTGTILAQGGQGGVGGNVDLSGDNLTFAGPVDLTAPGGKTGHLLIDPASLDVISGGGGSISGGQNAGQSSTIDPGVVESALLSANVTLTASTGITVNDAISWSGSTTLTLSTTGTSGSIINIDAPITGSSGTLAISTGSAGDSIVTNANGSIYVRSFVLENGSWVQNGASPSFYATNFELQNSSSFLRAAGGNGTSGNPYQITDIYGLQGLGSPSGNYLSSDAELVNNIEAGVTANWNSGAGFAPIGNSSSEYDATFNGQGYAINNLYINLPSDNYVGLFGQIGASGDINGVNLQNARVIASGQLGEGVGLLVGEITSGTVTNDYSTGTITGYYNTGGLVGWSDGTISDVASSATVNGTNYSNYVGGLVGASYGTLTDAYSTGAVTTGNNSAYVGGLVGNSDSIQNAYATGLVTTGAGSSGVGGVVGIGSPLANTFFDIQTTGQTMGNGGDPSGAGVTGATTAQLMSESFILANSPTSPTWDFSNVWTTNGGTTIPQLIGLPITTLQGSGAGSTSTQPSTGTSGAGGAGSSIVPPSIVPQTPQLTTVPSSITGLPGIQPTLVSFQGSGSSSYGGSDVSALADSGPGSSSVGSGDTLQMNDGQVNNVANPHAAGALDQALGPAVFQSLSAALADLSDWTSTSAAPGGDDDGTNTAGGASDNGGDQEVILNAGDVAEVAQKGVKNIPADQVPDQLKNALSNDTLQGMKGTGH